MTFTCEECAGEFVTDHDDEIAQAEAVRNFGRRGDAPGMAIVCDDCFKKIMGAIRSGELITEPPLRGH